MLNKPKKVAQIVALVLGALLLAAAVHWLQKKSEPRRVVLAVEPAFPVPSNGNDSYTTNFTAAEKPISEGGKWVSGKSIGIDWTDVSTDIGLAHGTESGDSKNGDAYDDSTALLAGPWRPDQTAEAEVHSVDQEDDDFEEVELRLRSSLSGHYSTGYEVLFRCSKSPNAYASIVRWDGKLGKFTYLAQEKGSKFGVANGDIVKATAMGNVITGYINGVPVIRATDSTYPNGSPGIGFWLKKSSSKKRWLVSASDLNTDCGFRRFAAWD